jgi:hypothetical protein
MGSTEPTRWGDTKEHKLFGGKVAERRDTSTSPPDKYRCIPFQQVVYHFEHSLSLGMLGMKSQGHGKLRQRKAETLKAKGHRELEDERAPRVGEKQYMAATQGVNPFLKADFSTRAPKRHGQGLPRCALGFPSYDTGARPHMSCKLARSAKKANRRTRSVQPPCGYTHFHLRRNQRSRRRTAAQGARNRPAVIRPFIFATTSGQEGEPPHKKRATAPRLCAPSTSLQPVVQPLAWGPRPTCHAPSAPVSAYREVAPPLTPVPCLLGAAAEDGEVKFSKNTVTRGTPRMTQQSH